MSLRNLAKRRIVEEMIRGVLKDAEVKYVAMVVDDKTLRTLSSCVNVYGILEEGVTVVELIEKRRQALPDLDAIYFLTPELSSVELLVNDFKNEKKPQYRDLHIFFSGSLGQDSGLMEIIVRNANILPRIKTFVEFNLNFICHEERIFHLDSLYFIPRIFPSEGVEYLHNVGEQLVSLCVTIGDQPIVRFHKNALNLTNQLAQIVHNRLIRIPRLTKQQTTLIIVDRSIDVAPLLLHDFTYQAISYDLLRIPLCSPTGHAEINGEQVPDDTFSYEFKTNAEETGTRRAVLGDADDVWVRYRHQHIAVVNKKVREEVSKFARDNAAAKLSKKKGMTNEETLTAVRALPQFQEMLAKYWVHVSMSERCFREIGDRKLIDVGGVEQDLATGVDKDGNDVSPAKLLSGLGNILSSADYGWEEKLRVLLLYFTMMDGIKEEEKRRMMEAAQLSLDNSSAVVEFLKMGIHELDPDGSKAVSKHTHKLQRDKERLKYFQRRAKTAEFALSRFQPRLRDIMEATASGNLHAGKFPYVAEPEKAVAWKGDEGPKTTALRADNLAWDWGASSKKKKGKVAESPRSPGGGKQRSVIIFCLGGVTMSEVRCAYEVSRQTGVEIYLGGSAVVTPASFLRLLKPGGAAAT